VPPIRDPIADHLLTPENAALLLADYQPSPLAGVRSMDRALLVKNVVSTVWTIKTFEVPVVHSTVNVASAGGSRRSPNSPACSPAISRSTGPRSTPGGTPDPGEAGSPAATVARWRRPAT
jgi:nicotinamidase-related amidase